MTHTDKSRMAFRGTDTCAKAQRLPQIKLNQALYLIQQHSVGESMISIEEVEKKQRHIV